MMYCPVLPGTAQSLPLTAASQSNTLAGMLSHLVGPSCKDVLCFYVSCRLADDW